MNKAQIIKPLLTTWGVKKDAGYWYINLPSKFICYSKEEQKESYRNAIVLTLDAFSSFAIIHTISFSPMPNSQSEVKRIILKRELGENYQEYIEKVLKALKDYPAEIYEIDIWFDLNVFVYTKQSPDKAVRFWLRYFGESIEMGNFTINISVEDNEPYMCFSIEHTLFYPFSYQEDDNTELFNLNQPLLEKALRNWEQKFDSEIEPEGLPGIYKYGFLPYGEW